MLIFCRTQRQCQHLAAALKRRLGERFSAGPASGSLATGQHRTVDLRYMHHQDQMAANQVVLNSRPKRRGVLALTHLFRRMHAVAEPVLYRCVEFFDLEGIFSERQALVQMMVERSDLGARVMSLSVEDPPRLPDPVSDLILRLGKCVGALLAREPPFSAADVQSHLGPASFDHHPRVRRFMLLFLLSHLRKLDLQLSDGLGDVLGPLTHGPDALKPQGTREFPALRHLEAVPLSWSADAGAVQALAVILFFMLPNMCTIYLIGMQWYLYPDTEKHARWVVS